METFVPLAKLALKERVRPIVLKGSLFVAANVSISPISISLHAWHVPKIIATPTVISPTGANPTLKEQTLKTAVHVEQAVNPERPVSTASARPHVREVKKCAAETASIYKPTTTTAAHAAHSVHPEKPVSTGHARPLAPAVPPTVVASA